MDHAISSTSSIYKGPRRENPNVARARELVLEHGWNSTSFQIVNPGIERWFSRNGDAVVGYVLSKGVRVVVGAPVCEKERLAETVMKFEASAKRKKQTVCYFAAETRLESLLSENPGYTKFLLGAQPAWHPAFWSDNVGRHKSLRAQLNRARNKGVVVTEWPLEEAANNTELARCLAQWLDSKGLPPLHFMVEPDTLARLENRRIFVAVREERVVGFVVLSPVVRRNGWLFEQFPHCPGAPNGTVELMIDTAMRALAADGCDYATLGLSPLSKRANVRDVREPFWLRIALAWIRKHGQRFYNFDGLDAFKAKLGPERWEPVFAVVNEPQVHLRTLYAIAGAFSGNAPFRLLFGAVGKAAATEMRWLKARLS
jgi:phosphatidylglycerol lysyltransferase